MALYPPPPYRRAALDDSDHKKKRHYFLYEERGASLTYSGNAYAFNIIIIAQFIFLNFGYIIGALLTSICIGALIAQIVINSVETHYLDQGLFHKLNITLRVHYWFNHAFILLVLPFLVWTVVLMFEKKNGASI